MAQNLGLKDTASISDCALARNKFTRGRITDAFFQGILPEDLPVNAEGSDNALAFKYPVFTVSAVDYQKLVSAREDDGPSVFSDVEDTEVREWDRARHLADWLAACARLHVLARN